MTTGSVSLAELLELVEVLLVEVLLVVSSSVSMNISSSTITTSGSILSAGSTFAPFGSFFYSTHIFMENVPLNMLLATPTT